MKPLSLRCRKAMFCWIFLLCGCRLAGTVDWTLEESLPVAEKTLENLLIIGVHGIRTPLYEPFKGDLHDKKYPSGENQLTPEGELQMRYVGRALRRRYYDLFVHRSSPLSRAVIAPESPVTNDSVRIINPVMFEHRVPTPVYEQASRYMDRTYMVYEYPGKSTCPLYACLREKYRRQKEELTRQEEDLFSLFSKKTHSKVTSLETFFPIYDRLLMEKLNKNVVPDWFNTVDSNVALGLKAKWKRKLIGHGEMTWKFFTDTLMTETAGMFQLESSLFDRRLPNPGLMKVAALITEDVLVYVLGWLMFQEAFEKEFSRPFSVEVGDTLLIELHAVDDKEVLKLFYYCPTSEDPDMRFKELSLKPFLEKNNIKSDQFLTSHLKYLMLPTPAPDECHQVGTWFRDDPYRSTSENCEVPSNLSPSRDSPNEL